MKAEPGLPRRARLYVAVVIVAGAAVSIAMFPLEHPRPVMFAGLLLTSCLTSLWKVNLPIALASSSTLSVSYAADLMALMVLGPRPAVLIASIGALAQCLVKVKRAYPIYRTVFSVAGEAITMGSTGAAYVALGGPIAPQDFSSVVRPLVGAILTYFLVNTGIVAGAIGLSTRRSVWRVWRHDFMWSGASFMVAGTAGALAAVVIARGQYWLALLAMAPIYLTYRTYQVFVARLEAEKRHATELASLLDEKTQIEESRRELLEREQVARASAEDASRMKDQFLAMVSHELRTPLNAVLGWADMLRSGALDDDRRARAHHAIYDSARRQAQLIEELLDVARIISGKLRLDRTAVDLNTIVRAALEVVQPAADAKRIHIEVQEDPSVGSIYADGARLQQIIWNVLSNAVKFTPEEGVVALSVRRNGALAEITVTDNGEGIPPDFLPSVFEAFRQADLSTTRRHSGLGLGLSIVSHLVEAHGGTISAESSGEGRGATFIVRLPIISPRDGRVRPPAPPPPAGIVGSGVSLEGLAVLVVDDDEANRDVVAAHLENHRATVLTASSAAQAFDLLHHRHVDVLLADIAMPGEDGYSLIRRVRASSAAATACIPAAALTSFAREEDRQRALRAGFQLHLAKPLEASELVAAVASLRTSVR